VLGNVFRQLKNLDPAIGQQQRALTVYQQLVRDFPSVPDYRARLAQTFVNLGNELDEVGRSKEAIQQYGSALALHERLAADYPNIPEYISGLANTRAMLASMQAIQGNYRLAVEEISRIDDKAAGSGMARYNVACAWSLILASAQRDHDLSASAHQKLSDDYGSRALQWLEKSRAAGYFQDGANLHYLQTDKDLDSLRSRPDFQKFVQDLQKQAKGK